MNLDELRTVQHKERQKDSLQHLRPTFYGDVGEYIADLEAERDRVAEAADDPFSSPDVGRLTDEIETAKDVVEAIYERRMGKLVKQASLAAAGMPADDEGLTAEESDLFSDLVSRIESNKGRVLEVLDGGGGTTASSDPDGADPRSVEPTAETPPVPPEEPPTDAADERPLTDEAAAVADPTPDDSIGAADVMGGATDDSTPPVADEPTAAGQDDRTDVVGDGSGDVAGPVDRLTVRITQDVGSILGVDDREYTLECDDVVTLPEQNAEPLVDRDAAEPLE